MENTEKGNKKSDYAAIGSDVFKAAKNYESFLTLGECFLACEDNAAANICFKTFANRVFTRCKTQDMPDIEKACSLYGIRPKERASAKDTIDYVFSAVLVANIHNRVTNIIEKHTTLASHAGNSDKSGADLLRIYADKKYSNLTEIRLLYEAVDLILCRIRTGVMLFSTNISQEDVRAVDSGRVIDGMLNNTISVGTQERKGYIIAI